MDNGACGQNGPSAQSRAEQEAWQETGSVTTQNRAIGGGTVWEMIGTLSDARRMTVLGGFTILVK